jgi:hypothetical protein
MGRVLLDHHRHRCVRADGSIPARNDCLITYGDLCSQARVPHFTRCPGPFLLEIAQWCAANGWPPLNALAVNRDSLMPGDNFDVAPGCSLLNWPAEVDACIASRGYPAVMP